MSDGDATRVGVLGAAGRMGRAVCGAVDAATDLALVAAVDPAHAGEVVAGTTVAAGLEALAAAGVEVAVDFTVLDQAVANARWCAENGVHLVVGTSGFGPAELDDLAARFDRSSCLVVPNFAIGAVLMMRFAELAAPWFETGEIVEMHHDGKVDAPSGTAVQTAGRMAAASDRWAPDPTERSTLAGARGAEGPGGIRIHALRMRGAVAHQEVVLGTTGETLTIRHDSLDRSSFMPGVLLAVRTVADRPGLTVGLDAALGID